VGKIESQTMKVSRKQGEGSMSRLKPFVVIAAAMGLTLGMAGESVTKKPTDDKAVRTDFVWWEAENPKESNFPAKSGLSILDEKEKAHLSGGAWLSADGGRFGQPPLFAKYEINVPKAGSYAFWTRKFWKHGPFKWRFDDQPWTECPYDCPLADTDTLRQFVVVNWVYLGEANLSAGTHIMHLEGTEFQLEKPKEQAAPPPPEYEAKQVTDWCRVTLPKDLVKAGQTIDIIVETKGIPGKYHLNCGMVNRSGAGEFMGMATDDPKPSPEFEGDSKHTFAFKPIPHNAGLKCIGFSIEYIPEGKGYKDRMEKWSVRTGLINVDQASIHPAVAVSPMCFDCFLLSPVPFVPHGKLKPGEKAEVKIPDGWFAFDPDPDVTSDALLDLRVVNQKEAGVDGWVKRSGKDLVFEKTGKPVRFWGVCALPPDWNQAKSSVDYLAKTLAKRGVNLVRMHMSEFSYDEPNEELDKAQYFMAAMKKQGIYVGINPFCSACYKAKPRWKLPEFLNDYVPYTELFFYKPLQERYKSWVKCLLATPNPYTGGIPMGKDPAVAYLEIIDESNYFWWAFKPYINPTEKFMPFLEKRFGDWLVKKYGSLDNLKGVWHAKRTVRGDDFANGRVGLVGPELGSYIRRNIDDPADQRWKDTVQFETEDLRQFWADMAAYFHNELGFGGEVCPSNWIAPENTVLDPLDKYTYTVGGIVARNAYVGCPHQGNRAGYAVSTGDKYIDMSTLLEPEQAGALLMIQSADYPFFWTEGTWNMPTRFRGEMPAMLAAYGSLQGMDGFMIFTLDSNWCVTPKKWPIQTPAILGQFPAAALIYRNGYVKESAPVIRVHAPVAIQNHAIPVRPGPRRRVADDLRNLPIQPPRSAINDGFAIQVMPKEYKTVGSLQASVERDPCAGFIRQRLGKPVADRIRGARGIVAPVMVVAPQCLPQAVGGTRQCRRVRAVPGDPQERLIRRETGLRRIQPPATRPPHQQDRD
jgi:hypothetical protein